jgi:hypothetical protein
MAKIVCECGAEYECSWVHVVFHDKDSEECECGRRLAYWNGSNIPIFRRVFGKKAESDA